MLIRASLSPFLVKMRSQSSAIIFVSLKSITLNFNLLSSLIGLVQHRIEKHLVHRICSSHTQVLNQMLFSERSHKLRHLVKGFPVSSALRVLNILSMLVWINRHRKRDSFVWLTFWVHQFLSRCFELVFGVKLIFGKTWNTVLRLRFEWLRKACFWLLESRTQRRLRVF